MRIPSSSPTGGRESPWRWTHWPASCLSRRTGSGPHRRRLRHENRRQTPDEVRMRLGTRINNRRTGGNSPSEESEWLPTLSTALVRTHTSRARSGWPGVSSTRGVWDEDVDPSSTMRMSPRGSRGSGSAGGSAKGSRRVIVSTASAAAARRRLRIARGWRRTRVDVGQDQVPKRRPEQPVVLAQRPADVFTSFSEEWELWPSRRTVESTGGALPGRGHERLLEPEAPNRPRVRAAKGGSQVRQRSDAGQCPTARGLRILWVRDCAWSPWCCRLPQQGRIRGLWVWCGVPRARCAGGFVRIPGPDMRR